MKIILAALCIIGFIPLAFAQIDPIPIPLDTTIIKQGIADQVNQYRVQNNLNAWSYDSGIENAAKIHSQDLIDTNTFTHNTPGTNINPSFRGSLSGYTTCGEPDAIQRYNQVEKDIPIWDAKADEYDSFKAKVEPIINQGLAPNIHDLYNQLITKYAELENSRIELNQRIDQVTQDIQNDKVGIGFSENIVAATSLNLLTNQQVIDQSLSGWIESSEHKAVLDGYGGRMGIGIVSNDIRMVITLDIC